MTRWLVGAVLAAGPLLLYPLAAAAQASPVAFACEYGPNFSYVIIKNLIQSPPTASGIASTKCLRAHTMRTAERGSCARAKSWE